MEAYGRLSTAAAADREARGGGVTELGREGPEMVEVVVRVPSDGMGLFKGVAHMGKEGWRLSLPSRCS